MQQTTRTLWRRGMLSLCTRITLSPDIITEYLRKQDMLLLILATHGEGYCRIANNMFELWQHPKIIENKKLWLLYWQPEFFVRGLVNVALIYNGKTFYFQY